MDQLDEKLLISTHFGEEPYSYFNSVVPPIFMNSLHVYNSVDEYNAAHYYYGRYNNPTVELIEKKICALENGKRALMFASGMAASSSAVTHACRAGSHIICQKTSYNPVKKLIDKVLIEKFNFEVTYVLGTDLNEIKQSVKDNTHLIMIESPGTFTMDIVDIEGVVAIAKQCGAKVYIDNTYCTPIFQNPLDMGVDYVMHTLSKYLGGHSDLIGGVLIVNDEEVGLDILENVRALYGGIIGPMEAWMVLRGLRTLGARMHAHQETALEVAQYLENHPKVKTVYYPGLPSHPRYELGKKQMRGYNGLLSLELNGTLEQSKTFCDTLKLFGKGCSWGGFESLAIMPLMNSSDSEVAFFNCSRNLIRLHCGLEGAKNLISDLENAFASI